MTHHYPLTLEDGQAVAEVTSTYLDCTLSQTKHIELIREIAVFKSLFLINWVRDIPLWKTNISYENLFLTSIHVYYSNVLISMNNASILNPRWVWTRMLKNIDIN